ncbi:hypothetical protein [Legionella fallonii]|uniref:Uncharacterized protein n=1 Tax=Legionella fallonii LLAP-10 TaxID=1212491 RepID=A0A098G6Z5_9GAMM|nr:hypothetical protein [Legionella fallonii]CEG57766.1 protein of unknown function [Legionella fallonii LLAP-10]
MRAVLMEKPGQESKYTEVKKTVRNQLSTNPITFQKTEAIPIEASIDPTTNRTLPRTCHEESPATKIVTGDKS